MSTLQDASAVRSRSRTPAGELLPAFIAVSNIESREPDKVRAGNERVVRPRLADAAFFWEQDRRQPLAARIAALDGVTFQAQLGSLGDKARRVACPRRGGRRGCRCPGTYGGRARRRALPSATCSPPWSGSFPSCRASWAATTREADGEPPRGRRGDPRALPAARRGRCAARDRAPAPRSPLADRLDTLAGIFAIGEKPSGTRDPFGLRRAALGVQRILIEKHLDLDLRALIGQAVAAVLRDVRPAAGVPPGKTPATGNTSSAGTATAAPSAPPATAQTIAEGVYDFVMERLRAYYLERPAAPTEGMATVTTEMFDAVLAARPSSPVDFDARLKALSTFLELPESGSLTAANKRIANILRKAPGTPAAQVDVHYLRESAEVRLYDAMRALRDAVADATGRREYTGALGRLAQLRPAVDAFFDQVLVMDEDPQLRGNRLSLLAQLQGLFAGVADLSRLPG